MTSAVLALSAIGLLAFFIRGITGAASAIVFNAAFVTLLSLGLVGGLSLHDGLYWIALVNFVASAVMFGTLRRSLVMDRITGLFLAGSVPVIVVFSVALTRVEGGALTVPLAVIVMASGVYLAARPRLPPADPVTLSRVALPVGMAAGVIGGLYGMGGPISFLLFSRASPDPSVFRGRLTVVTLAQNTVRLATLVSQGVYTSERLALAAAGIPAVLLGIALGLWVHRFVTPGPFRVALGALISLSGLVALVESLGIT